MKAKNSILRGHVFKLGAGLLAAAFTISPTHAFLFEDGTFDAPLDLADGVGWESFGTPDAGAAVGREDWANGAPGTGGAFGYAATGDGQHGIAFKAYSASAGGFYHDVPVEPARSYDFHIQSHTASNFFSQVITGATGTVSIVFSWYDGPPDLFGSSMIGETSNDITSSITDGGGDGEFPAGPVRSSRWQDWDYAGLSAPAGAAYLRVTIQWSATAVVTGGDEAVRWDNAELTTALDPLNETQTNKPVPHLTHSTQTGLTYTTSSSPDLLGFDGDGFTPVVGDGSPFERFLPFQGDRHFYRVDDIVNGLETTRTVRAFDVAGGDEGWQGFMNVFELPANGGAFVFDDVWGVDDLVSDISSTTNEAGSILTLSPNTIGDPNEFWYQNTSGTAPDPTNPGGPGQLGNKIMDANLFTTHTNTSLSGQTVTFEGTVLANSLTSAHSAVAFIKDFSPDFSSNISTTAPLTPGPFSIMLATDPGAGRHIQFGFTLTGENVWVTDVAPFGNVQIAIEPFVIEDTVVSLDLAPADTISWDGQLGVHYIVEYSDDGGSNWFPLFEDPFVGTGDRLEAVDPSGTVSGRSLRVVTQPMVPLGP